MKLLHGGWVLAAVVVGCAGHTTFNGEDSGGPGNDAGNTFNDAGQPPNNDSGNHFGDSGGDAGTGGSTTVYANTDDTLFTMDPTTDTITQVGKFTGMGGGTGDLAVTDLAVNQAGDVYVNTESVVYKATIPSSPGNVALTQIKAITLMTNQKFVALAFTPPNSLDTAEVLIGGDTSGELYSINTTNGATKDLGNFGPNPSVANKILTLSGDLVFYTDAKNNPTGLATVRSCSAGGKSCAYGNDYLVAVDMAALANAYKATAGASLLKGIYGGSTTSIGNGVGKGDLFGLGAWEGNVYAFARSTKDNSPSTAMLLTIDTTTGAGTIVTSAFTFTNGWSGAGVTTSAPITVPPPN